MIVFQKLKKFYFPETMPFVFQTIFFNFEDSNGRKNIFALWKINIRLIQTNLPNAPKRSLRRGRDIL